LSSDVSTVHVAIDEIADVVEDLEVYLNGLRLHQGVSYDVETNGYYAVIEPRGDYVDHYREKALSRTDPDPKLHGWYFKPAKRQARSWGTRINTISIGSAMNASGFIGEPPPDETPKQRMRRKKNNAWKRKERRRSPRWMRR
jgi:hypothetical protein